MLKADIALMCMSTLMLVPVGTLALPSETVDSAEGRLSPKVFGGEAINISATPYQVSVRLIKEEKRGFGMGHVCGGSIISNRAVLSAAHCVWDLSAPYPDGLREANEFTVVMGTSFRTQRTDTTMQFNVQKLVVHEQFSLITLENDIALLFLSGVIPNDIPHAQPIQLDTGAVSVGTECLVSGWGLMTNNQVAQILQAATVPVISNAECALSYGGEFIAATMICAGFMVEGGVDSCQGDSGGPLQCSNRLAGIVSFGEGCALPNYPGVYTRVASFADWIHQHNSSFDYTDFSANIAVEHRPRLIFALSTVLMFVSILYI